MRGPLAVLGTVPRVAWSNRATTETVSAVAKMTQTDSVSGARRPIDDPAPSVLAAEDASELIDASTTNIASVAVAGSALAVAIGGVAWGLLRRRSSGRG